MVEGYARNREFPAEWGEKGVRKEAGSCSTCCPTGFSGFALAAFSPTVIASPNSRWSVSCWLCPPPSYCRSLQIAPNYWPNSPRRQLIHAPAVSPGAWPAWAPGHGLVWTPHDARPQSGSRRSAPASPSGAAVCTPASPRSFWAPSRPLASSNCWPLSRLRRPWLGLTSHGAHSSGIHSAHSPPVRPFARFSSTHVPTPLPAVGARASPIFLAGNGDENFCIHGPTISPTN